MRTSPLFQTWRTPPPEMKTSWQAAHEAAHDQEEEEQEEEEKKKHPFHSPRNKNPLAPSLSLNNTLHGPFKSETRNKRPLEIEGTGSLRSGPFDGSG